MSKHSKSVAISIDWDFFVPEDPIWDLGHRETELHLNYLWKTRGYLLNQMVTTSEEETFWDWCYSWAKPINNTISVSDSHLFALEDPAICSADVIVLIDQHHDLFGEDINLGNSESKINCGNWLKYWLQVDSSRKAIWVKPAHSYFSLPLLFVL
jgi:hypothetical protein